MIRIILYSIIFFYFTIANAWADSQSNPTEKNATQLSNTETNQQAVVQEKTPAEFSDPFTGMQFVLVPGGCFSMGNFLASTNSSSKTSFKIFWYLQMGGQYAAGEPDELPVHEVCLDNFYIGKFEVTQKEYQKVMGNNPAVFKGEANPVEQVSWYDTQKFLQKLNQQSGLNFRLPTEAEWEFAARSGGKNEKFSGSNTIDDVAWWDKKRERGTRPVGMKQANGLGLYDMSGNVWEWCQDWYSKEYYALGVKNNPTGPDSGTQKVFRGGAWNTYPRLARTAKRRHYLPSVRGNMLGFRLVLPAIHGQITQ